MGNAHNVAWEIEADEEDFKSHVAAFGPPLKKAVPFSTIEAGGCRATSFGVLPSLLNTHGSDLVAMKPFTVTVTFEWTLPWTTRRQRGETQQTIDVRQFAELFWDVKENHIAKVAKALEGLESIVREAVGEAGARHTVDSSAGPVPGPEPSERVRRWLRGGAELPR